MKNIDIAKKLGISPTAVSLALNNHSGVSEKTRHEVMKLKRTSEKFKSLNINQNAANPVLIFAIHRKHGQIINDKPFFSSLISTIQQEAMLHTYALNILHYSSDQDTEKYMENFQLPGVAGIILLATEMDKDDLQPYKKITKPMILLDSSFDLEQFDSVTINNRASLFQTIEYAYHLGHRNIGYLKSNVHINNFEHRFEGYKSALRYYHLEGNNNPIFSLHCNTEQAYQDMKDLLLNKPHNVHMPSIFVSDLDYIALGAIRALKEYGYRIPEDISVIGYDDIPTCEVFDPPLTTVQVNREDIGRIAVRCLIEKIASSSNHYINTQISASLMIRGSTGPPLASQPITIDKQIFI